MTDLEKFIALYKDFGIDLTVDEEYQGDTQTLVLRADHHEKLDGYNMFYSDVEFDKDGRFLRQGFWE